MEIEFVVQLKRGEYFSVNFIFFYCIQLMFKQIFKKEIKKNLQTG